MEKVRTLKSKVPDKVDTVKSKVPVTPPPRQTP